MNHPVFLLCTSLLHRIFVTVVALAGIVKFQEFAAKSPALIAMLPNAMICLALFLNERLLGNERTDGPPEKVSYKRTPANERGVLCHSPLPPASAFPSAAGSRPYVRPSPLAVAEQTS